MQHARLDVLLFSKHRILRKVHQPADWKRPPWGGLASLRWEVKPREWDLVKTKKGRALMLADQGLDYAGKCGPGSGLLHVSSFSRRRRQASLGWPKCCYVVLDLYSLPLLLGERSGEDMQWGWLWFPPNCQRVFVQLVAFVLGVPGSVHRAPSCLQAPDGYQRGMTSHTTLTEGTLGMGFPWKCHLHSQTQIKNS